MRIIVCKLKHSAFYPVGITEDHSFLLTLSDMTPYMFLRRIHGFAEASVNINAGIYMNNSFKTYVCITPKATLC